MNVPFDITNALYLDVFREIGNIGSSSAATALSKIVDRRIALSLPHVDVLKFNEISRVVGGEEELIIGILQPIMGDIKGKIMFLLRLKEAHDLAAIVIRRMLNVTRPVPKLEEFDEMERSALGEIGHIMIGSYLSAISTMTSLKIRPMVPQMALDMAGAILSVLTIEYGAVGDHVLYIASEFSQDNIKVGGDFFLVPDMDSFEVLLRALGVG
jgi:chemotaxis protein CheC